MDPSTVPTYEHDGKTYVEYEAGMELARRIAREDASLLARLAEHD